MDNLYIKITILFSVLFLVSISSVFAFGISSPYWKDNPLEMHPGETKDISFVLQNCPSLSEQCEKKDADIFVSLTENGGIAEIITGNAYRIPFGTADTEIKMRITIPADAGVGEIYNLKFFVGSSPEEKQGNIQFGVRYNVDFPVIVIEKPIDQEQIIQTETKEKKLNIIAIILLSIIALIVLIIIFLKKNKSI